MAFPLNGLVTLITGASSGIGEATAVRFAHLGSKVALVARRRDKLEKIVDKILAKGDTAMVIAADISHVDDAKRAVNETLDAYGRLDVLVNNAGVMLLGPATEAPLEEWKQMIAVNLSGLLYMTHAALPHLVKAAKTAARQVADIINISSTAGRRTYPGAAVYNATKYGVVGLSGALRQELKSKRIRVSVVEPGFVDTELAEHSRPEIREQLKKVLLQLEPLHPQDVADAIEFLVTRHRHVLIDEIMITPAIDAS
jgi:NADP-dependent 3-hydroxy acid dehydrogenase YdfG